MKKLKECLFVSVILVILSGVICSMVYYGHIKPRRDFQTYFGFSVPSGQAELFAIEPVIKDRLYAMRDEIENQDRAIEGFYASIRNMPADSDIDRATRKAGFERFQKMKRAGVKQHYRLCDANRAAINFGVETNLDWCFYPDLYEMKLVAAK